MQGIQTTKYKERLKRTRVCKVVILEFDLDLKSRKWESNTSKNPNQTSPYDFFFNK